MMMMMMKKKSIEILLELRCGILCEINASVDHFPSTSSRLQCHLKKCLLNTDEQLQLELTAGTHLY